MATTRTNPKPTTNEDDLSREQWWSLFDELRRSQQVAYAEHGGPSPFVRQERNANDG